MIVSLKLFRLSLLSCRPVLNLCREVRCGLRHFGCVLTLALWSSTLFLLLRVFITVFSSRVFSLLFPVQKDPVRSRVWAGLLLRPSPATPLRSRANCVFWPAVESLVICLETTWRPLPSSLLFHHIRTSGVLVITN